MGAVAIVPTEVITSSILLLRGQKVLLDRNLAALYRVETRVLVQAVQRNLERFPGDFMFRLTKEEAERVNSLRSQIVISNDDDSDSNQNLRSQIVISSSGHGGARYDEQFKVVWEAIRELITPPAGPRRQLGFAVATES